MSKQILVPDVGEADEVSVIEILVDVGDVVSVDDSLVVLESEKASMEIPSPFAPTRRTVPLAVTFRRFSPAQRCTTSASTTFSVHPQTSRKAT